MVQIRKFKEEDINQLVELFISVFEQPPWNDNWPSQQRAKEYITDIINTPGFKGFVAVKEKEIVGVILGHIVKWWTGDEFFIKEYFVVSDLQGQGIGSKLYEQMTENLQQEEVKNIILLTEKDTPAFDFYKQKGLQSIKKTTLMYQSIES